MRAENDRTPALGVALVDDGGGSLGQALVELLDRLALGCGHYGRLVLLVIMREHGLQDGGRSWGRVLEVGGAVPLGDAELRADRRGRGSWSVLSRRCVLPSLLLLLVLLGLALDEGADGLQTAVVGTRVDSLDGRVDCHEVGCELIGLIHPVGSQSRVGRDARRRGDRRAIVASYVVDKPVGTELCSGLLNS